MARASDAVQAVRDEGARAAVVEQRALLAGARGELARAAALPADATARRAAAARPRTALEQRDVEGIEALVAGAGP